MTAKRVFRFIDLFSGAGGLALGFRLASDEQVEFRSVFAVEIEPAFAASYAANFGDHVFRGPIRRVGPDELPPDAVDAEIVIGGPPCQGFSPLGRMSPTSKHAKLNSLWRHYFRVVGLVKPLAFVIENVPEFLKSRQFGKVETEADNLGYDIKAGVRNAADFGVPQVRRRGFVIGVRRTEPNGAGRTGVRLPDVPAVKRWANVRSAIGDLIDEPLVYDFRNPRGHFEEPPVPVNALHIGRNPTALSIERYKWIPAGGNRFDLMKQKPELTPRCWLEKPTGSTDVFGRLKWEKPALTIRTEFFKPEKGRYLHPHHDRPITHWEAARLQTFPDNFLFCGSKLQIARQIGNAVPPKLALAIAETIKEILTSTKHIEEPAQQEVLALV